MRCGRLMFSVLACSTLSCLAWPGPDFEVYHRTDDLLARVRRMTDSSGGKLKRNHLTAVSTPQSTTPGATGTLEMVASQTANAAAPGEALRVMIICGEHGREMITSEVGYYFLALLAGAEATEFPKVAPPSAELKADLARIGSVADFKVVPIMNHEARRKVENGEICARNPRGTDLERNWGYKWSAEVEFPDEEFPGKAPFTEWELVALREEIVAWKPHVYVIVHSGEYGMYTPWTSKKERPPNSAQMMKALQITNQKHCQCHTGAFAEGAYTVPGSSIDWVYDQGVQFSYVWEIYGVKPDTHRDDCFRMFNPLTHEGLQKELHRWAHAFLTLASAVHADLSATMQLKQPGAPSVAAAPGGPAVVAAGAPVPAARQPGIVTNLEGGVKLERVRPGFGAIPERGDLVSVHYTGRLASSGLEFDSSHARGAPIDFTLGVGQVIRGWDIAVAAMQVGDRATVHIPAALAHGSRGAGGDSVPPYADLVFDVTLVEVKHEPSGDSMHTILAVEEVVEKSIHDAAVWSTTHISMAISGAIVVVVLVCYLVHSNSSRKSQHIV